MQDFVDVYIGCWYISNKFNVLVFLRRQRPSEKVALGIKVILPSYFQSRTVNRFSSSIKSGSVLL